MSVFVQLVIASVVVVAFLVWLSTRKKLVTDEELQRRYDQLLGALKDYRVEKGGFLYISPPNIAGVGTVTSPIATIMIAIKSNRLPSKVTVLYNGPETPMNASRVYCMSSIKNHNKVMSRIRHHTYKENT